MTKAQAKGLFLGRDRLAVIHATDYLFDHAIVGDLPFLISAFGQVSGWLSRIEIVEMVGQFETPAATEFLLKVAKSRAYQLVRSFAMRYLIERGDNRWRPASRRSLKSDFYAPLVAYDQYWKDEIDLATLKSLALNQPQESKLRWEWLTYIEEESE